MYLDKGKAISNDSKEMKAGDLLGDCHSKACVFWYKGNKYTGLQRHYVSRREGWCIKATRVKGERIGYFEIDQIYISFESLVRVENPGSAIE